MKKVEKIQAYFMRVDEITGQHYQGYLGEIDNTLEAKQLYVNYGREDGVIQVLHLNSDIDIICHDEGKLRGFPYNRAWIDRNDIILDVFAGNILAVRHKGDEFASIRASDIPYIERHLPAGDIIAGNVFVIFPSATLPKYEEGYPNANAD